MSLNSILSFSKITIDNAEGKVKAILEKALRRIGYIPNLYTMMANSPPLLKSYTEGDELFRKESVFNSAEKEVIYLTISKENMCLYCIAVHSTLADTMSNVPKDVTNAIRDGEKITNDKYATLNEFTRIMVVTRGRPTTQDIDKFIAAGYSNRHILDIIHAIAIKTMSNYSNHLFQTPLDAVFQQRSWENT